MIALHLATKNQINNDDKNNLCSSSDQPGGKTHTPAAEASHAKDDENRNADAAGSDPVGSSIPDQTARKRSYRFMTRNYRASYSSTSSEDDNEAELEAAQENHNVADDDEFSDVSEDEAPVDLIQVT